MDDQKSVFNKSVNKSLRIDKSKNMEVSKENEEGKEEFINEESIRKTIGKL